MVFFKIFYSLSVTLLLAWVAREDGLRLRIPPGALCLLTAWAIPCALWHPAAALIRLGGAFLISGSLAALILMLPRCPGKTWLGGGDIKLLFALLLHTDWQLIPLYGCIVCIYILLTYCLWTDKKRLPLGPSLGGAWLCLLWAGLVRSY